MQDEIAVHVECTQSVPTEPLPEKVMQWLKAERARMARLDPEFHAELKRAGIFLTPEELGETEPPTSGNAATAPS